MKERDWDKLLRIHTAGRDDSHADTFRYPYEPTPYRVLERLAGSGCIRKDSTVIDYGCGKGRVGCFLAYQTGCRVIGVDHDARLIEKALENKQNAPRGSRLEFVISSAEKYDIPPAADGFYFFNPFSVELLQAVWKRIAASYYDEPRPIQLFFYYPSDEYVAWLMSVPELEFDDEIPCDDLFGGSDERERILVFRTE